MQHFSIGLTNILILVYVPISVLVNVLQSFLHTEQEIDVIQEKPKNQREQKVSSSDWKQQLHIRVKLLHAELGPCQTSSCLSKKIRHHILTVFLIFHSYSA